MRRLLLLAVLIVSPTAVANDLAQPVTAMLYWQTPLDSMGKRDSASTFGFRLDRAPVVNSVVFRKPLVDVRFNQRGFHSLAWRGAVLHQNQPASGEPAPDINWWLVLGISAAAVAVIHDENKKSPTATPEPAKKGVGN